MGTHEACSFFLAVRSICRKAHGVNWGIPDFPEQSIAAKKSAEISPQEQSILPWTINSDRRILTRTRSSEVMKNVIKWFQNTERDVDCTQHWCRFYALSNMSQIGSLIFREPWVGHLGHLGHPGHWVLCFSVSGWVTWEWDIVHFCESWGTPGTFSVGAFRPNPLYPESLTSARDHCLWSKSQKVLQSRLILSVAGVL